MRTLARWAVSVAGPLTLILAAPAEVLAAPLSLTTSWYADAAGTAQQSPASTGAYTAVSATNGYTYGQQVLDTSGHKFTGSALYGFDDAYAFTLTGPASANSLTATINLGSLLDIQNLQVRLFQYNGSTPIPLALSGVPAGGVAPPTNGWTPVATGTGWTTIFSDPNLAAGNYVLEVRGVANGSSGGTYAGLLQIGPVPLPAGLPLLLSGLGLFGAGSWARARERMQAAFGRMTLGFA